MKKLIIINPMDNEEMGIHIINITEYPYLINDDFIKSLGFSPNKCDWFIGSNVNIYNGQ